MDSTTAASALVGRDPRTKDVWLSYWTPVITQWRRGREQEAYLGPRLLEQASSEVVTLNSNLIYAFIWMLQSYFYVAVLLSQERGKAQPL